MRMAFLLCAASRRPLGIFQRPLRPSPLLDGHGRPDESQGEKFQSISSDNFRDYDSNSHLHDANDIRNVFGSCLLL